MQIPKELQAKLEEFCLTDAGVESINTLRGMLGDLFGKEVDVALEGAINELLPTYREKKIKRSLFGYQTKKNLLLRCWDGSLLVVKRILKY